MAEIDEGIARRRRRRAFERRALAAVSGLHLPTLGELLRNMPFLGDALAADVQAFAERVLLKLDLRSEAGRALHPILVGLTLQPQREDYLAAAHAFTEFSEALSKRIRDSTDCADRCRYYAAADGCQASAKEIGSKCLNLARHRTTPPDEAHDYAIAGIGWCIVSAAEPWLARIEELRGVAWVRGTKLVEQVNEEQEYRRGAKESDPKAPADGILEEDDIAPHPGEPASASEGSPAVVVVSSLGNADLSGASHIRKEFQRLLGAKLPLAPVPDLSVVRWQLATEFPHAEYVIDDILGALVSEPFVRLRPTILIGSPGCGKSTFASRLLGYLGIPHDTYPCGGVSDSSLGGTARRWSSGEPSFPLALVRRYAVASPGIVLDEIEKAGTSRSNGALVDVLLGLLERQTARAWHDPYLQAPVDLAHVVWIATANSLEGIPMPLRDRCRVLRFASPSAEHLPALASHLLKALVIERGLDQRWALPLDAVELAELAAAWPGGSIRALGRLIEGVLKARETAAVRH